MTRTFFIAIFLSVSAVFCITFFNTPKVHAEAPKVIANTTSPRPAIIQTVSSTRMNERTSRHSSVAVQGLSGGHGSGTYIKHNDHYAVLTARHVVDDSNIFYVSTGAEKVVGQVIWKSETHDIALLKIPRLNSRKAVNVSRHNRQLSVGDEVVYSGYPASYDMLTTRAYVTGYEDGYRAVLLHGFIWFGYSGSGVFNAQGDIVGIVVAVGVQEYDETRQVLEDLVYMHELSADHVARIRHALR